MFQLNNLPFQNIQVLLIQKTKSMLGDKFLAGDSSGSNRFFR